MRALLVEARVSAYLGGTTVSQSTFPVRREAICVASSAIMGQTILSMNGDWYCFPLIVTLRQ